jgi:hypothetical protein
MPEDEHTRRHPAVQPRAQDHHIAAGGGDHRAQPGWFRPWITAPRLVCGVTGEEFGGVQAVAVASDLDGVAFGLDQMVAPIASHRPSLGGKARLKAPRNSRQRSSGGSASSQSGPRQSFTTWTYRPHAVAG